MSEIELPMVDKDRGVIVSRVNVDSYSAGTGWYVHFIPDKTEYDYCKWRNADSLTKWCDSELVKLPESFVPDDVDEEWVTDFMAGMLIEDGDSMCLRCASRVDAGSLVAADGSYVANICPDCKGICSECGANSWEALGKKNAHNAKEAPKKKCNDCGHKTASGVSTA